MNEVKRVCIRHGDLSLVEIDKLPEGLKKSKSKVLMTGSHNNDHTYDFGEFYPKQVNQFIFGYFVAYKNTKLYHVEHGKEIESKKVRELSIPEKVYQLEKQQEITNVGMRPVAD